MGNTVTVTPRICPAEAGTARGRRPKSFVTEASAAPDAAPRRLTVTPRKQRDGVELERQDKTTRPGPGRPRARAGGLSWAEALVARLNALSERERKARMAELKGEFRAGDCAGGASPRPCRDAWKPRLVPIREN
jgi:hypothetical protein